MKIRYQFTNGEINEVEVSDEIAEVVMDINESIAKSDRRETRRHSSIDDLMDQGIQIIDLADIAELTERADAVRKLHNAINDLLPQQKELVNKVFFEGRSIASIAVEQDVSEAAIRDRLKKIFRKLKRILT